MLICTLWARLHSGFRINFRFADCRIRKTKVCLMRLALHNLRVAYTFFQFRHSGKRLAGMMASALVVGGRTHFRRIKYAKQCKLPPGQQNNNNNNGNKIKTFPAFGPKINFCFRWRADFPAAFLTALLMLRHRQPTTDHCP